MIDPNLLTALISALCIIESGGNVYARGDWNKNTGHYDAIGILQQHKIFVDEVNRILLTNWGIRNYRKVRLFNYFDRENPIKAKLMTEIWFNYYLNKEWQIEKCVRFYKAGSKWKNRVAQKYWLKVKAELEKQK